MNRDRALAILGLAPGASEDDIKAAYRDLSQIYHPDKHLGQSERVQAAAANKFKELSEAYAALTHSHDRDRYHAGAAPNSGEQQNNQSAREPAAEEQHRSTAEDSTTATQGWQSFRDRLEQEKTSLTILAGLCSGFVGIVWEMRNAEDSTYVTDDFTLSFVGGGWFIAAVLLVRGLIMNRRTMATFGVSFLAFLVGAGWIDTAPRVPPSLLNVVVFAVCPALAAALLLQVLMRNWR